MEFKHLDDTRFPNFDTVHPYQFKNEFDYSRWIPGTKIKACNVPWDYSYENVVKFDTDAERDVYFDSIDAGFTELLNVDARVLPENYVKLPLPFDMMAGYNYLVIDIPVATGAQPIDYENVNGFRRWHFFVTDMQYIAPNTTQVFVQLDVWTQYINSVDITYMMLERGHAPVAATDVDDFLADPLANNKYLLAPDFNYGISEIIKHAKKVAFGNGEKYICFVTHYDKHVFDFADQFFGQVTPDDFYAYRTPTFTDEDNVRWGYLAKPNNYGFTDARDYSSLVTPNSYDNHTLKTVPNNLSVICVKASDCYKNGDLQQLTFIEWASQNKPTFFKGVEAIFMADANMIERGDSFTFGGFTMWWVSQSKERLLDGIRLTREMFDFPAEIADFAKLYTYPYSSLEVTDNRGEVDEIRIENIAGDNKLNLFMSCAYPYINLRAYMTGICGTETNNVPVWYELDDSSRAMNLPDSDWLQVCYDFNIPTYAYYMTPLTSYMVDSFHRNVKDAMSQFANAYTTNAREANNAKANADDSADFAHQNAVNNANLQGRNADRIATNQRANAYNARDMAKLGNDTNRQLKVDVKNAKAAAENALVSFLNQNDNDIASDSNVKSNLIMRDANTLMIATQTANADTSIATTERSGQSQIIAGLGSGLASAAGAAGMAVSLSVPVAGVVALAALPAITSVVSGSVTAATNNYNATILTQASALVTNATVDHNIYKEQREHEMVMNRQGYLNDARTNTAASNQGLATDIVTLENAAASDLADSAYDYDTYNADNTYAYTHGNGLDTQTTGITNAGNTQTVTKSNANYTRLLALQNLQDILRTSMHTAESGYLDALKNSPAKMTEAAGDLSTQIYKQQGITIRIKTQSEDALQMAGAMFARYGYALNQVWNVSESGLNLMEHFTYWKAGDIWLVNSHGGNAQQNETLRSIFKNGVTVWSNPNELGGVSIYDN